MCRRKRRKSRDPTDLNTYMRCYIPYLVCHNVHTTCHYQNKISNTTKTLSRHSSTLRHHLHHYHYLHQENTSLLLVQYFSPEPVISSTKTHRLRLPSIDFCVTHKIIRLPKEKNKQTKKTSVIYWFQSTELNRSNLNQIISCSFHSRLIVSSNIKWLNFLIRSFCSRISHVMKYHIVALWIGIESESERENQNHKVHQRISYLMNQSWIESYRSRFSHVMKHWLAALWSIIESCRRVIKSNRESLDWWIKIGLNHITRESSVMSWHKELLLHEIMDRKRDRYWTVAYES